MKGYGKVKGFGSYGVQAKSSAKLTKNVLNTVVAVEALSILPRVI